MILSFLLTLRTFSNWLSVYRYRNNPNAPERFTYRLRNGLRLVARPQSSDTHIIRSIVGKKNYLPEPLKLSRGDTVVDIGAHIGTFTLTAAAAVSPGRVLACEPEPGNYSLLSENVSLNKATHVTLIHKAIAGSAGSLPFHVVEGRRTGMHSLLPVHERFTTRTIQVPAITLEQLLTQEKVERIDFLKLDCEGAEHQIFDSLDDGLLSKIRQIAMEFHPRPDHPMSRLAERLKNQGFQVWPLEEKGYFYAVRK